MKSSTIATAAVLMATVLGKDKLIVKENADLLKHKLPEVDAYNCRICIIDNENVSLCLTYGASW